MPKMSYVKQYFMCVLLLGTCAWLAQCVLEPAPVDQFGSDSNLEKDNADMLSVHKRPAFFVGSRYGRAAGNTVNGGGTSKARRLIVVPRNDRFFLGSRYGKRANEYASPYEQSAGQQQTHTTDNAENLPANNIHSAYMSCSYTGFSNYYRCSSVDEVNNIINRFTNTATGMDAVDDAK